MQKTQVCKNQGLWLYGHGHEWCDMVFSKVHILFKFINRQTKSDTKIVCYIIFWHIMYIRPYRTQSTVLILRPWTYTAKVGKIYQYLSKPNQFLRIYPFNIFNSLSYLCIFCIFHIQRLSFPVNHKVQCPVYEISQVSIFLHTLYAAICDQFSWSRIFDTATSDNEKFWIFMRNSRYSF